MGEKKRFRCRICNGIGTELGGVNFSVPGPICSYCWGRHGERIREAIIQLREDLTYSLQDEYREKYAPRTDYAGDRQEPGSLEEAYMRKHYPYKREELSSEYECDWCGCSIKERPPAEAWYDELKGVGKGAGGYWAWSCRCGNCQKKYEKQLKSSDEASMRRKYGL